MVPGLDSFREKFKNYTDYYTIIGGTACDILLSEADLPFRATKDIDMILIMEDNFPREKFKNYTDYYTIIGGTACDILLSEADLPFRATKDIDMILIMEDNFP